jgi:hypothetical protein
MFGSFLPSLRSSINHSLLGSRSRHCYAIKFFPSNDTGGRSGAIMTVDIDLLTKAGFKLHLQRQDNYSGSTKIADRCASERRCFRNRVGSGKIAKTLQSFCVFSANRGTRGTRLASGPRLDERPARAPPPAGRTAQEIRHIAARRCFLCNLLRRTPGRSYRAAGRMPERNAARRPLRPGHEDPRRYSLCAAATDRSSRRSGRTEKNLCLHGSQRNAASPRIRQRIVVTPGTCSAEMRCSSRLPQIPQCA